MKVLHTKSSKFDQNYDREVQVIHISWLKGEMYKVTWSERLLTVEYLDPRQARAAPCWARCADAEIENSIVLLDQAVWPSTGQHLNSPEKSQLTGLLGFFLHVDHVIFLCRIKNGFACELWDCYFYHSRRNLLVGSSGHADDSTPCQSNRHWGFGH